MNILTRTVNTIYAATIVRVMEFSASITHTCALRMIHTTYIHTSNLHHTSSTMSWHSSAETKNSHGSNQEPIATNISVQRSNHFCVIWLLQWKPLEHPRVLYSRTFLKEYCLPSCLNFHSPSIQYLNRMSSKVNFVGLKQTVPHFRVACKGLLVGIIFPKLNTAVNASGLQPV